ncbi:5-(carboxyamino)imidazole ribonucleotide mutase [Leptolyngbyaceae cyanobacterium CCMR0082]|uniref:N5-carboxyaminoimidazole ribonucleotide mutase n=2 Tax=Adonisia turfae TaxID=2950184 RepID=A0A6M0S9C3_9CYAN|nr:5-(carboxyamino)imidazole ribonucleotide mutase [Adonisia turfae]MDV3352341.1 5-(carboxyamino)imidazole ribonucleotide mutase [Leptothoe sp. LEGE 181152]NEZ58968.1 5-(carboxyamino)imidazole ribonucleotide mutase [Adonisia turfae CCMR0081]NEZ65029.1 5-(carboxyamino)imidazole ribonucleotide mutase [Adonisia turfae CCMR0082]
MTSPLVGIIMGSDSDLPTMEAAITVCEDFGIPHEVAIVSAHRTPKRMVSYAQTAVERGLKVIIAGAGGAAHLPGMVAALTPLPVIGVPVKSRAMQGIDSLYSIVQMPGGIPVATVAIGNAKNAGLLAVQILATCDRKLLERVQAYRKSLEDSVLEKQTRLNELGHHPYLKTMFPSKDTKENT